MDFHDYGDILALGANKMFFFWLTIAYTHLFIKLNMSLDPLVSSPLPAGLQLLL